MNIEERIKNDLHNFLVKVEKGRKEHSPAMNVEAYLIDMFAKQMAAGVLLEISLHDKELIEKIEEKLKDPIDDKDIWEGKEIAAYNRAIYDMISMLKHDK